MKKLFTAILILFIVITVYTHSGAALEGNTPMLTAQERLEAKKDLEKLSFSKNKYFKVNDETGTLNRGEMKELLETLLSARKQIGGDLGIVVSDVTKVNILPYHDKREAMYAHRHRTVKLHPPKANMKNRGKLKKKKIKPRCFA